MMNSTHETHEVISALLDDEPFDRQELESALSEPAGRALLIDIATLRRIVQPVDSPRTFRAVHSVSGRSWRVAAAAAGLVLALASGYVVGARRAVTAEAPPPTRVVEAVPFVPGASTLGGIR
jgi:hypothetical protein